MGEEDSGKETYDAGIFEAAGTVVVSAGQCCAGEGAGLRVLLRFCK